MLVIASTSQGFSIFQWCDNYRLEPAFDSGKSVVQIAAIEIAIGHLLDTDPPESAPPREMLIIDPDEGLKIAYYTAVVIRDCGYRGR